MAFGQEGVVSQLGNSRLASEKREGGLQQGSSFLLSTTSGAHGFDNTIWVTLNSAMSLVEPSTVRDKAGDVVHHARPRRFRHGLWPDLAAAGKIYPQQRSKGISRGALI